LLRAQPPASASAAAAPNGAANVSTARAPNGAAANVSTAGAPNASTPAMHGAAVNATAANAAPRPLRRAAASANATAPRRVAVIIRGEARSFGLEASYGSFRRYVVDEIRAAGFAVDVFGWIKTGTLYERKAGAVCRFAIAAGANAGNVMVETQSDVDEFKRTAASATVKCGDKTGCLKRSLMHQVISTNHSYHFVDGAAKRRSGKSAADVYDWVLDLRADLRWVAPAPWKSWLSGPRTLFGLNSRGNHPEYGSDAVRLIPGEFAASVLEWHLEERCKKAKSWCVPEDYFKNVAYLGTPHSMRAFPATIRRDKVDDKWDLQFCKAIGAQRDVRVSEATCKQRVRATKLWPAP